jgi:hypothetical protein
MNRPSFYLFFFASGAVAGTLLDEIHVAGAVLEYPHPIFLGEAWWVPIQYGLVSVLSYLGALPIVKDSTPSVGSRNQVLISSGFFVAAYFTTAFLEDRALLVAVILVGTWVVRILLSRRSVAVVAVSIGITVVGVAYEAVLVHVNAFSYESPDIIGVPVWLAGLYLHAGIFTANLTKFVDLKSISREIDRCFVPRKKDTRMHSE